MNELQEFYPLKKLSTQDEYTYAKKIRKLITFMNSTTFKLENFLEATRHRVFWGPETKVVVTHEGTLVAREKIDYESNR